jgi:N-methylhydantoinase A
VLAQAAIAVSLDLPDAIGIDIGGTSTDISLVVDGRALLKAEHELEFGTVVAYPMIDVDSIGAGGGTIAWVDAGGLLHVGPQSAGAVPGPVALAAGGTEPTVTDAHVVLRRLGPTGLLGGRVTLDEPAARAALAELGTHLGLGPVEMAAGVLRLTDASIVAAIRQRTVERGLDPRRFALIAYGGAGPLHAAGVAEQLGIERVVVPRYPGTTSAQGLLLSDIRHDFVATFLQGSDELDPDEVERIYAALEREGRERLRREGIPDQAIEFSRSVDARYRAQTHELNVAVEQRPFSGEALRRLLVRLRDQHRSEFGHAPEGNEPVELVNLRVGAIGLLDHPAAGSGAGTRSASPGTARDVYLDERWQAATVWMREELVEGQAIDGPAVVEQLDSTTIVPPRWTATVDRLGDLVLRPV